MTKDIRDDKLPPAAPEALQRLGLSEEQIARVKQYVWARLRMGSLLRTAVVGFVIVVIAHLLLPAFSEPHAAYRTVVEVGADYVTMGLSVFSAAMLGLVVYQLWALDRVLITRLGLSARASAHVRRIARYGTFTEAFGERVARLIVYGVVREGPAA